LCWSLKAALQSRGAAKADILRSTIAESNFDVDFEISAFMPHADRRFLKESGNLISPGFEMAEKAG
jgi:hypothetical protein